MRAEETPSQANSGPEPRRPFWIIGLALLGLVVILLAVSFLLNQQLRPRVGIEPPPVVTTAARSTSAPPAIALPTVSVPPSPTSSLAAGPTATVVAAPTATVGPLGPQIANSPLELEVEAAYENYLRIYSDAVLNLDTSHLNEVLAGQAQQLVTDEVNDLKAGGRSVKIIEDERIVALGGVTMTTATVMDEYVSRSVYIDPSTNQPLPRTGPPTRVRQSYELRKIDGVWKIIDGTRENLGEVSQ